MNRWFWRAIIAAVLVVVAVWLYSVFFPSPERVIRARLTELAKSASFSGNESPVAAMANAQRVARFFMEDVEIRVDLPGRTAATITGRDDVRDKTTALRSLGAGLQVEFLDINVTVAPDKNSAEANLTLKGRIAGERDLIVQELKMLLNKIDGDWKIKRVETVKTLSFRAWLGPPSPPLEERAGERRPFPLVRSRFLETFRHAPSISSDRILITHD